MNQFRIIPHFPRIHVSFLFFASDLSSRGGASRNRVSRLSSFPERAARFMPTGHEHSPECVHLNKERGTNNRAMAPYCSCHTFFELLLYISFQQALFSETIFYGTGLRFQSSFGCIHPTHYSLFSILNTVKHPGKLLPYSKSFKMIWINVQVIGCFHLKQIIYPNKLDDHQYLSVFIQASA